MTPENSPIMLAHIDDRYTVVQTMRHDTRGGGAMILINKTYTDKITPVTALPYVPPSWIDKSEIGKLELVIAKFKPKRLPRGYSTCIVACAYIPG